MEDIVLNDLRQNALPITAGVAWIVATLIAGWLLLVSTHTSEMHPWSPEWKKAHAENANNMLKGNMGPVDMLTRLIMGNANYARDMKTAFQHAIRDAEDRAATPEELEAIQKVFTD